jgi:hypothetical protein
VVKEKGLDLYTAFITILNEEAVAAGKAITIKAGVYGPCPTTPKQSYTNSDMRYQHTFWPFLVANAGNRQALSTESDGPYTHMFEF